jgi:serine/threonine protein kinase
MSQSEQREEAVFEAALKLSAAERTAYLDHACAADPELRGRVERLLASFERAGGFMNHPATPERNLRLSPGPTEKPGDRIGRYKLLEQIGEGGCGVVYMAEQEEPIRRKVALKVIKLGMDTKQVIARFEAERQALALMDHPNIAKVLDAGATDTGRPYFVMELVRGIRITEYCDQNQLPTAERLKLFTQVCQAIQHAHQKGIIHRDIKPSNILVTVNDGVPVPKVIDFGIAKATQGRLTDHTLFTAFEQFLGTPAYMSPEQAMMTSLDIDTRSDIYSLGVLLYELLTGQTPFDQKELLAAGLDAMRRTIREKEPPKPSTRLSTMLNAELMSVAQHQRAEPSRLLHTMRGDLDWIVMKALEKDRARRYETANGLALDIRRHLDNEPIEARPPGNFYRFQKSVRRNKLAFGSAATIALALLIGLAVSVEMGLKARREAAKSRHVAQFLEDMLKQADPNVAPSRDTTLSPEIADRAAENARTKLADEPEVALEIDLVLANVYWDLRECDKMAESAQEARRLAAMGVGMNSLPYADATSSLARALQGLGKAKEAETTAREAIALQRKARGPGSIQEAGSLACLSDALRHLDRLPEAESAINQSLAIYRQRLGHDTSEVVWALNSLNIVLVREGIENKGKLPDAERAIREAIAISTKLSPNQEQLPVAIFYERLASTIMASGATNRLPEAEDVLRKSIAIENRLAGEKHPNLAFSHFTIARLLEQEARLSEAEAHYRAAAEVARSAQGMSKEQRAYFILELGRFLGHVGKQQEVSALIIESQALSSTPRL